MNEPSKFECICDDKSNPSDICTLAHSHNGGKRISQTCTFMLALLLIYATWNGQLDYYECLARFTLFYLLFTYLLAKHFLLKFMPILNFILKCWPFIYAEFIGIFYFVCVVSFWLIICVISFLLVLVFLLWFAPFCVTLETFLLNLLEFIM